MKSYTSKKSTSYVKFPFQLDGEAFTVTVQPDDAVFALEFSELSAAAEQVQSADLISPEAAAFVARYFKLVLGAGEYARFKAHLRSKGAESEVLGEIMADISDEIERLSENDAARPTMPSRSSSGGHAPTTGDRASQLSALAGEDADVIVVRPDQARPPTTRRKQPARNRKTG